MCVCACACVCVFLCAYWAELAGQREAAGRALVHGMPHLAHPAHPARTHKRTCNTPSPTQNTHKPPRTHQVPFLSREREAVHGQGVVLEALQALYNICKFNKRVHLEVAATGGIVPHLCRCAWLRAAPAAVRACVGSVSLQCLSCLACACGRRGG
jgi:hypothetical protein